MQPQAMAMNGKAACGRAKEPLGSELALWQNWAWPFIGSRVCQCGTVAHFCGQEAGINRLAWSQCHGHSANQPPPIRIVSPPPSLRQGRPILPLPIGRPPVPVLHPSPRHKRCGLAVGVPLAHKAILYLGMPFFFFF